MATDGDGVGIPAQALDCERSLLGIMLAYPACIPQAIPLARPAHFYRTAHGHVFLAMVAVHLRGDRPDIVTVAHELRERGQSQAAGGEFALAGLMEAAGSPANLTYYARQVRTAWATRQRVRIGQALTNGASSDPQAAHALLEQMAAIAADEQGPGRPKWAASILSGPQFDAVEFPPLPSLLGDGLLGDGELGVLYGATGRGKSFLGEQLCHAVATGEDWLGMPTIPGGCPVLAIHLELSGTRLKTRRGSRWGSTPPALHTLTSGLLGAQIDILNEGDKAALCEATTALGARLVYVDPLQELHNAGETNDAYHLVVRSLMDCMIRTGAAFLLSHHEPKPPNGKDESARSDMDALRGGTRLAGAVKLAMRLKKLAAPNRFDLVFAKVTHREAPESLYLKQVDGGWFEHAERPEAKQDRSVQALERILLGAGIGHNTSLRTLRDALASLGLPASEDSTRRALNSLAFAWGFQSRTDLQIGVGKGVGYTYRKAEHGSQASGVAECDLLPQDCEDWQ